MRVPSFFLYAADPLTVAMLQLKSIVCVFIKVALALRPERDLAEVYPSVTSLALKIPELHKNLIWRHKHLSHDSFPRKPERAEIQLKE